MNSINFPNLGIHFNNVGQSVTIFGFSIAYYGMIIGLAIFLGFVIGLKEAKRTGQNPETYMDMGIIGVVVSIITTRLYYVIFSWEHYRHNLAQIIDIRQGGLAIYGGIIGAFGTVLVFSKIKKLYAPQIADTIALCIINGQILGRWGNFFNREAFGGYSDGLLAMQLPLEAVRGGDVTLQMLEHIQVINGIEFIQVHPTFLYESLWNLGLIILMLLYRNRKKFEGEVFLLYLFGYGVGRFWIEALRTDQLMLGSTNIAVSQVLSAAIALVSLAIWLYVRIRGKGKLMAKA